MTTIYLNDTLKNICVKIRKSVVPNHTLGSVTNYYLAKGLSQNKDRWEKLFDNKTELNKIIIELEEMLND